MPHDAPPQSVQEVTPSLVEIWPAGHELQLGLLVDVPATVWYWPAAHCVSAKHPVFAEPLDNWPAGQLWHVVISVAPVAVEYLPVLQATQSDSAFYSEGYPAQPRTRVIESGHLPVLKCPVHSGTDW